MLWHKNIGAKAACKMLMTLTTGLCDVATDSKAFVAQSFIAMEKHSGNIFIERLIYFFCNEILDI